jgi:hypothetical protein
VYSWLAPNEAEFVELIFEGKSVCHRHGKKNNRQRKVIKKSPSSASPSHYTLLQSYPLTYPEDRWITLATE